MDRWQEMLVENKMGSLGFGGHFAGCGHEGPQPRQIEAPGKPEQLHSTRERAAERAREAAWQFLLQALDAPHMALRARPGCPPVVAEDIRISGSVHSQQTPGLRQARGSNQTAPLHSRSPPDPPLPPTQGTGPFVSGRQTKTTQAAVASAVIRAPAACAFFACLRDHRRRKNKCLIFKTKKTGGAS